MKISFGKIEHIVVLGGSWVAGEFLKILSKKNIKISLISGERHIDDVVDPEGNSLRDIAEKFKINILLSKDINKEKNIKNIEKKRTLFVAMGAPWIFEKKTVKIFNNKLVDFMGIPLPKFRGGAHYSWQILSKNRQGECNIQIVNGGIDSFHKGKIIKNKKYLFPKNSFTPEDFFKFAIKKERLFLRDFIDEIIKEKTFTAKKLIEKNGSYFPFLNTEKHGWINWNWKDEELENFINAFGDPYKGASTFIKNERVFIKNARIIQNEENFHPFQSGLVVRKDKKFIYVASHKKLLTIESVFNKKNREIFNDIKEGDRFYTSSTILDDAMCFQAIYDANGLKK